MSKDALDGSMLVYRSAGLFATIGDRDSAVRLLEEFMTRTHFPAITATWLKLDPTWTPLRADPRFQRVVAGAK